MPDTEPSKLAEDVIDDTNPAGLDSRDKVARLAQKLGRALNVTNRFWSTSKGSIVQMYDREIGVWKENGEEYIAEYVCGMLDSLDMGHRTSVITETISYIRATNMHWRIMLSGPPEVMVLANGRINIETGEFYHGFDPEEHHVTAIPITYDESAKCPKFDVFLHEVLETEEDVQAIYEMIGYCLFKDWPYDILLIFIGGGANGKSVLLEVISEFLGGDNVTVATLQTLASNRFASARLYGKLANIAGEIPAQPIKFTERVKDLSGGGLIEGERKFHDGFKFRNYAKLLFSTNNPPEIYDESMGWWRRLKHFTFPMTFPAGAPGTIPRDKLVESLTSPEEMSGLLNASIKGWQRLRTNGRLSGARAWEDERIKYIRQSSPGQYLVETYMEHDVYAPLVRKDSVYDLYVRFCQIENKKANAKGWFFRDFKRHAKYAGEKQRDVDIEVGGKTKTKKVRVFDGLKIDFVGLEKVGVDIHGIDFEVDPQQETLGETKLPTKSKATVEALAAKSQPSHVSQPFKTLVPEKSSSEKESEMPVIHVMPVISDRLRKPLKDIVKLWGATDHGLSIKADADNMDTIDKGLKEGYLEEHSAGEYGMTAKAMNEISEAEKN